MSEETPLLPGLTREALVSLMERHGLGPLHTALPFHPDHSEPMLLVNGEVVVRLNQKIPELPTLPWEAVVYRRLRRATDVPAPQVLALDTRRDIVPWDVLCLSYVEGVRGNTVWVGLDVAIREHLSEELGRMCAAAHGLSWTVYGQFVGFGPAAIQSGRWAEIVNQRIVRVYEQAQQVGLLSPATLDALITVLNDGDALFDTPSPPTLTHTDLGLWNVVLRQEGSQWHVAAILDWQRSLVADAAWEFAQLWRDPAELYPLSDSFLHGYKERKPLQDDLRVRQRLYRLLSFSERAIDLAQRFGTSAERTQFFHAGILRLLKPR